MYCLYFLTKCSNLFCMSWKVDCKMSLFRYVMAAGYSRITRRNFGFQLGTKELFKQWNALQIRICFFVLVSAFCYHCIQHVEKSLPLRGLTLTLKQVHCMTFNVNVQHKHKHIITL